MQTIEIFAENESTVKLTVRPARAIDNLRREMLTAQAIERPAADDVEQTMAIVFYPRCVCVTKIEINGEPVEKMTLTEFCEMPSETFERWWQAVIDENPRWNPARQPNEKKT